MAEGPFDVIFDSFDPSDEKRRESLFSLGNGVLTVRGAAPEEPAGEYHYPGTYRAGCYNRPSTTVHNRQVENESLVNLPNWLPLSFRIDGEADWFSLHAVDILTYRHVLYTQHGFTRRTILFRDHAGRLSRLSETRLVSMANPRLAALRVELTPEDWSGIIEIRSAIDGDIVNANIECFRDYDDHHLEVLDCMVESENILLLRARTRQSRIELAYAARTELVGADRLSVQDHRSDRSIAQLLTCEAARGHEIAVEKIVGIVSSHDPAIAEASETALKSVRRAPGFHQLLDDHKRAWMRYCGRTGITAEREDLGRAIEFHRLHSLQTVSQHSTALDVGFPARGWQEAYHGQIFWDDIFVFPYLNVRFPDMARGLLLYRYRRLDEARHQARECGYRGAMYPWRSASDGREVTPKYQLNLLSGRWMRDDTELQRHVGSAIAYNIWSYFLATGDVEFLSDYGAEMLLEIARFWASIASHDPASDRYDILGVVGPDEYHNLYPDAASPGLDNNAYTNIMAVWTLCRALEVLGHLPHRRREELRRYLEIGEADFALWERISRRMRVIFLDDGVISQFDGFERLRELDCEKLRKEHPGKRLDWIIEARGERVDEYQVTKQADVLMLFYLLPAAELTGIFSRLGYELTEEQLRRTLSYYLDRISHESSLSQVVCAGALAQLDPARSWETYGKSLHTDFVAPHCSNTAEGLHLGAMAGTMDVLQRHYLGLRPTADGIRLEPSIPSELGRVSLAFHYRGEEFELEWSGSSLTLRDSETNRSPVEVTWQGQAKLLEAGSSLSFRLHLNGDAFG